jgi:hypothetical protein
MQGNRECDCNRAPPVEPFAVSSRRTCHRKLNQSLTCWAPLRPALSSPDKAPQPRRRKRVKRYTSVGALPRGRWRDEPCPRPAPHRSRDPHLCPSCFSIRRALSRVSGSCSAFW